MTPMGLMGAAVLHVLAPIALNIFHTHGQEYVSVCLAALQLAGSST